MIRTRLVILFLAVFQTGCAQHKLWKTISTDQSREFYVEHKGEAVDLTSFGELPDTIRASLVVNHNPYNVIRFADAFLEDETLKIIIHETTEADHHEYLISVSKNKYRIQYIYFSSGETEEEGKMIPYETGLILNTSEFRPGSVIKGYTEFKGKCSKPCAAEWIMVKGNFEVTIE